MIKEILEVRVDADTVKKLIKEWVAGATYKPTGEVSIMENGDAWVEVENEGESK